MEAQREAVLTGHIARLPFVKKEIRYATKTLMAHFVPHTDDDFARMLGDLGLSSPAELFSAYPRHCAWRAASSSPQGMSEPDVAGEMSRLAGANRAASELVCFAGGGAYDHDMPAVTRALAGPLGVRHVLHALPAGGGSGSARGPFRVPDPRLPVGWAAGRQRLRLRRGDGDRRSRQLSLSRRRGGRTVWVSAGLNPRWRQALATLTAGRAVEIVDIGLVDAMIGGPAGRVEESA